MAESSGSKVRTLDELAALRAAWFEDGKTVVWTNGCFDLLHVGHIRSFRDAKALGDILIVGINSDASVRALKGDSRPIVNQADRAEMIAALEMVDYVTIFDESTPVAALSRLRPDIHCKGAEYADGARPVPRAGDRARLWRPDPVSAFSSRAVNDRTGRPYRKTCRARMSPITMRSFLDNAPAVTILVAGDVMLDTYVSGSASRISPEAPVPVVGVSRRRYLPGGAANVAANIQSLGARVAIAGVTGVDDSAIRLRRELENSGADLRALVEDAARLTTTKTRITAGGQQIVRFDEEDRAPLSEATDALLRTRCAELLPGVDACVISDYAKGVISDSFSRWLIGEAIKCGKPVVVDPKSPDLARYQGATVVTPNLKETAAAAGEPIETAEDLAHAVNRLLPRIAPSALLVTRGEDGMSLFEPRKAVRHLPALRNEVADVTGAGDTVVGVLAIALGLGLPLFDAASIANIAAGVAVGHPGTWAVRREELLQTQW